MVVSNAATFRPLFRKKASLRNVLTPMRVIKRRPQSSSGYPSIATTKSSNIGVQEQNINLECQESGSFRADTLM